MSSTKTRELFERQAELLRGQLRQLQPDLMRELESVELALRNMSPDPNATEYAGYRLAIDAIEAWLNKHHHTAPGSVIAKAIVNGGWLAKDDRAEVNILDSIRYHLKHPTKRLKAFRGVATDPANAEIGLFAWDDSYHNVPPAPRFENATFLEAVRTILKEHGGKMSRHAIYTALDAGGFAPNQKRRGHNLRISMDLNVANGDLLDAGKDYIDLPKR